MQRQQYQVAYSIAYEDEAGNLKIGSVCFVYPCGEVDNWVGQKLFNFKIKFIAGCHYYYLNR